MEVFMSCSQKDCGETISENNYYLEIYKLHANIITETSNRRVNVSRYYILALSVLVLALSGIIRIGTYEKIGILISNMSIGIGMAVIGVLGILISYSWLKNMSGYLRVNSEKYKLIQNLESYLPYKFFQGEWGFVSKNDDGSSKTYWELAINELYTPPIFGLGFSFLMLLGLIQIVQNSTHYFAAILLTVIVVIVYWEKFHNMVRGYENE